ncbi:MAG: hypothetical protein V3V74_07780 [Nitrosomonadaceae bacterium]
MKRFLMNIYNTFFDSDDFYEKYRKELGSGFEQDQKNIAGDFKRALDKFEDEREKC